uniref:RING-type domain-containing protein n=1 Tax=Schizophyllum commune (strain H4-8 / FGSC 9210) TaxID=578458 RepID=D8QCH7_SCHCM
MSFYNYVDTPNANLVSCSDRAPYIDPVTTRTCYHTFCRECIGRALAHSSHCPVDRSPLASEDLIPASPIVIALLDELEVECIHRSAGCKTTCQRQSLASHLKDSCQYNPSTSTPIPETRDGEKESSEVASQEVREIRGSPHTLGVPCTHSQRGCQWRGRLASLTSEHIPSCPFEAIKGFFTMNDNRFSEVLGDNLLLRQRIETLEHTVKTMRHELDVMRAALGPWYRPESVMNLRSPHPPQRPLSSVPTMQTHEPHAYTDEGTADPLASYFPPADDIPIDSAAQQRALRRASTDYSTHASTSTTSAVVAPLDLGSSLEGALVGLRESMVTLAASVDSLGRRSEIALTNESMRLNEEVMSLRAALHGLRMQVHAIMLDRNSQITGRTNEGETSGWLPGPPPPRPPFFPPMMSPNASITKL